MFEVGGVKTWAILAKYHKFPSVKPSHGKIWTKDFLQECVIQSDGHGGSKGNHNYIFLRTVCIHDGYL